jgi:hypothetical protein
VLERTIADVQALESSIEIRSAEFLRARLVLRACLRDLRSLAGNGSTGGRGINQRANFPAGAAATGGPNCILVSNS